jgi:hypothetical protein
MTNYKRADYIPADARKIADDPGFVAYAWERHDSNYPYRVIGFAGKEVHPRLNSLYKTADERDMFFNSYRNKTLKKLADRAAYTAARREARKAETHSLKVGDILEQGWGYEQTNYDFYQVTRVISDKTVELRHINSQYTESRGYEDGVLPVKDGFHEPRNEYDRSEDNGLPFTRRANKNNWVSINSFSGARLWNGQVRWQTAAGYGH